MNVYGDQANYQYLAIPLITVSQCRQALIKRAPSYGVTARETTSMTPSFDNGLVQLYQADARSLPLANESVHCVVTSPPYWGLRDYGLDGGIGLEPTLELYVEHMVEVFREVWRVLRQDGTLWLNLGDAYSGSWGNYGGQGDGQRAKATERFDRPPYADNGRRPPQSYNNNGLKPKDLIGLPWRVAFALQADGWWLRSDIVWHKLNPMPESVTDRPTRAHEYVFLLTKSGRYFFDADAIREPAASATLNDSRVNGQGFVASVTNLDNPHYAQASKPDKQRGHGRRHAGFNDCWDAMPKAEQQAMGTNKRTVWRISTQGFPGAHFATFPEKLVEPCILAGTSEKGVCGLTGDPWERVTEVRGGTIGQSWHDHEEDEVREFYRGWRQFRKVFVDENRTSRTRA